MLASPGQVRGETHEAHPQPSNLIDEYIPSLDDQASWTWGLGSGVWGKIRARRSLHPPQYCYGGRVAPPAGKILPTFNVQPSTLNLQHQTSKFQLSAFSFQLLTLNLEPEKQ